MHYHSTSITPIKYKSEKNVPIAVILSIIIILEPNSFVHMINVSTKHWIVTLKPVVQVDRPMRTVYAYKSH